jgi:REP element-mobilizing transposase RayT
MARGNAREEIFLDDEDRTDFLANLGRVADRFDWRVWAWCLMGNHYYLLVETLRPTLSRGMREINGVYTQGFNRRHGRVGHVLHGRYNSILVDKDSCLLELSRNLVLNPVRAALVAKAGDWAWSSYRAVMGKEPAPAWLAVEPTLRLLHSEPGPARRAYARFVAAGMGTPSPLPDVERQCLLGSEAFIDRMAKQAAKRPASTEVPRRARIVRSLVAIARDAGDRDSAGVPRRRRIVRGSAAIARDSGDGDAAIRAAAGVATTPCRKSAGIWTRTARWPDGSRQVRPWRRMRNTA